MEAFYNTHKYLVEHTHSPVRRLLMDEIDWSHRLIGIKGSRGVGKTTFLLQYAKERFGSDRSCLYVNFNNFYFAEHSLVEFAEEFYSHGGRTLLIDQTFKYENWSKELRMCYDRFPELHIVFSGSSVMRLIEENEDLASVVKSYNLRGFSFREFLNLKVGSKIGSYTLDEIVNEPEKIARKVCEVVDPFNYFDAYLQYGYYPFFLENRDYRENLLKTMNMMLEVDILIIKQIETKYLSKIRKLLSMLITSASGAPNVSNLSKDIETSRATVMKYMKYLTDARLINTLYNLGDEYPKKPNKVFVHNTNMMHATHPGAVDKGAESATFFYNALMSKHKVNACGDKYDFVVDGKYFFRCETTNEKARHNSKFIYVTDEAKHGTKNAIPLWMFGLLY